MNGLRSRVRIEADSKLMSGRDVAIAALLGAEEFGFGTGPLVAMGCVMMRVCNLDTCPMGICTQNPELRKRFKGKPEYIMNFMRFMAEDLREYMAKLGVRTVDELVGRTDLLKVKPAPAGSRAGEMDLTALLQNPLVENSNVHFNAKDVYNFQLEKTPDMRILMKKFKKSFDSAEPKPSTVTLDVGNTDRAFGTIIGSEITARFGNTLPDDTFHVVCHGYGGQSFGAFIPKGLTRMTTSARACPAASSSSTRRRTPPLTAARTSSSATWHCTVLRAARRSSTAWPVSASACATPAQLPLWRAWATMAAST